MYELDSSIVLHYARNSPLSQTVEQQYRLFQKANPPFISVVVVAEVRAIAAANGWGAVRSLRLEEVISKCQIIPLPFGDVIERYVEVSSFSRQQGRAIGQNDMWIAATAIVTGATLFTTDRDFDHLDPTLLTRRWIDPQTK